MMYSIVRTVYKKRDNKYLVARAVFSDNFLTVLKNDEQEKLIALEKESMKQHLQKRADRHKMRIVKGPEYNFFRFYPIGKYYSPRTNEIRAVLIGKVKVEPI